MDMAAAFLFMDDDGAGLSVQTELRFGLVRRLHHVLKADLRFLRWIQAQGKQELLAPGRFGDGVRFRERTLQVTGHEAAQFLHGDVLIVAVIEKVRGELTGSATLRTDEDHASAPRF